MYVWVGPFFDDGVSIRVSAAGCCSLLMLSIGGPGPGPGAIPGQHANCMFRDLEWTDDEWLSLGAVFFFSLLAVNNKRSAFVCDLERLSLSCHSRRCLGPAREM